MSRSPRVAVHPRGDQPWLAEAVRDGGGQVVAPADAEALVWNGGRDVAKLRAVLEANPGISWVQLPMAGIEAFARDGVLDPARRWTCAKGAYAPPVAEHALTLALAGLRNLRRFAEARAWTDPAGFSLLGGNVTIFGGGGITTSLVRLLRPFDCTVTVVRRRPEPLDGVARVLPFEQRYEALKGADLVVLALALTPDTEGLVGAVELELMEPHAWLVNVARGRHVVTADLVTALQQDTIGGAALDVTDPEPLPEGHPLWDLPNCIVTPHTANTEAMAMPLLRARVRDNVARFAADEPLLGVVDPAAGY